ncbi:MAG: pantetheine-phosphate adenylyltransferase [Flexilinea sp.]|jgi:pantetheine-phosphate adenylyltransferase
MLIRAIFPGSFDPVHYGHINIARRAAMIFDELVVAVYENPKKDLLFSTEERLVLLRRAMADIKNANVMSYSGLTINFAKRIDAKVMVRGLRVFSDFDNEFRMALANQELDKNIETVSLITNHRYTFISSSTVKEIASLGGEVNVMVPSYVEEAIHEKLKSGVG